MPFYSPDFFKNPIKLNRPVSEEERGSQLKKEQEQPGFEEKFPHYQLSVIQYNKTFIDLVDRNYPVRGIATFISLVCILFMGIAFFMVAAIPNFNISDFLFILILPTPIIIFGFYTLFREAFYYTHFPMRINRINRKVYIWRKKGILVASWDKVFFFVREYMDSGSRSWDIRGNVLAEDGVTVVDSFPFGGYCSADKADIKLYFEYFRRYMEVGLEQPYRMLKICLPIAKRRETWWEGQMRLFLNVGGWWIVWIIMLPFFVPIGLTRWFAMHTSRIPQWPEWVEKECAIDPNDPFVRESGYIAPRVGK